MLIGVMETTASAFSEFTGLMPCPFDHDILSSLASLARHGGESGFKWVGFSREITFSFIVHSDDMASTDDVGSIGKFGERWTVPKALDT